MGFALARTSRIGMFVAEPYDGTPVRRQALSIPNVASSLAPRSGEAMSRFHIVLFAVTCSIAASCSFGSGPDNLPDPYLPAFVQRRIWLAADADSAYTDRAITITG